MTVGDAPTRLPNTLGGLGANPNPEVTSAAFDIGSVVAGKFRIDRVLAAGGMGLIVAATHLQLEQTVALKFFRGDLGTRGEPLMRFMREAKAAAQLKSEHVARVLDVGVTEGGTPYIVMEYLEGRGLESVVAAEGHLDVSRATEYAIQACEGLAEAHARGIVHRDIKPSNLFLVERSPGWRTIKILDFGISKLSFARASNITTHQNMVMGTPCYMSPEQLQSTATVDHRTDIWSLGATLYEMLTGKTPFDPSLSLTAIAEAIVSDPVPTLGPKFPQKLAAIVARSMCKDREERFQSAAAFAMALLPFARARSRVTAERAASMTPMLGLAGKEHHSAAPESDPEAPWNVVTQDLPDDNAGRSPATAGTLARGFQANQLRSGVRAVTRTVAGAVGRWPPNPKALVVMGAVVVCAVAAMTVVDARRHRPQAVVAIPVTVTAPRPAPPAAVALASTKVERVSVTNDVIVDLSLDKKQNPSRSRKRNSASRRTRTNESARATTVRPLDLASGRTAPPMIPHPVDPAGGRSPLRPVQTKNPYGNP